MEFNTIRWLGGLDGHVELIDQTRLPTETVCRNCVTANDMWDAIKVLSVRGAPAIGIAAAMGLVLGVRDSASQDHAEFLADLRRVSAYLATSRPTAVNLFWALDRMERLVVERPNAAPAHLKGLLLAEAREIAEEDRRMCRAIGRHGAELISDGDGVLTHCNAGGLATGGGGTALAVIFAAHEQGKTIRVFADETRPLLQGARLTTWELQQAGVPVTLICDNMAAQVMRERRVQCVVVGADRIASNGDAANKIGTYGVSVLAAAHGIPFYVAAPSSTFDLSLASGDAIPIEQRDAAEVTQWGGRRIAPDGVDVYNPAFDVTPAENIAAIVTELGVIKDPTTAHVREQLGA
jgi:methylthioribose-1-phosphate isomerase